ncbi:hypothetical protein GCM10020331_048310 [Ectobacillus funiculus]
MIGDVKPVKDDLYTPRIEGADEETREMSYVMARSIYGETLPEIVEARLEKGTKEYYRSRFCGDLLNFP